MDNLLQLFLISLGFLLVFLNGFFVASEFSIVKVRETRVQELVRLGNRPAQTALTLVRKMDEYLSATQLGITLASLGLGWIGEPAFAWLFEPLFGGLGTLKPVLVRSLSATSAFLLITFLHIVLGELAPKSLAIWKPEAVVLRISRPLHWFHRLSFPLIWTLNGSANYALKLIGVKPVSEGERAHSEEELRLIIARSQEKGVLERDEKKMLERVLEFTDRSVRQVMVPSPDVAFLDVQRSLEDNLAVAREHEHTRYPLCEGSFDRVLGVVHVKELFWKQQELGSLPDLASIKKPVQFVPDSKYISALLTEFRDNRVHLAVVVDEYGSNVGIVALEDILEELVGEIEDEFDIDVPSKIRKTDDRHSVVQGLTLLHEVERAFGITIDDEENDTIAGHVMTRLGRTARLGDEIVLQGKYRVRVVGMEGFQITDLVFEKMAR